MMRKLLLLFAVMASFMSAKAQTLYELKYYDIDLNENFQGLFFYTNEEDCTLRCTSTDSDDEDAWWEAEYSMEYNKSKNGRYMLFYPTISRDDDGLIYPSFYFYYNDKGEMNGVAGVLFQDWDSSDEIDYDNIGECEYFREVNIMEKDENYFLQFYDDDEDMYLEIMKARRNLKNQTIKRGLRNDTVKREDITMHLLMVASTNDETIGQSTESDIKLVRKNFGEIAEKLGIKYQEEVISGSDFEKTKVNNAIDALTVKPQDIIVYVYSGHGFRFDNDSDPYPRMFLSSNSREKVNDYNEMSTTEAYKKIESKGARLVLFVTDCCNNKIGMVKEVTESASFGTKSGQNNTDLQKLEMLFIEERGTIRVTAAKAGQTALCDGSGGYLITSFLNNIRSQVSAINNTTPSWNSIMNNASKAVEKKSSMQLDVDGEFSEPQVVVKSLNLLNSVEAPSGNGNSNNNEEDDEEDDGILWGLACVGIPLILIAGLIAAIILIVTKKRKNK